MSACRAVTFVLLALLAATSLRAQGLLAEEDRTTYDSLLETRRAAYPLLQAPLWSVLDRSASADERDALLFQLATTPLSDLVDHEASFLLANTRAALETRRRTSWGKSIPDVDFLHFVLPTRAGSEAVDSFRLRYGDELLRRVDGLTMRESVLEINHWCHEHVTYAPSDARTRAPLATIRNAQGRCGEESVFTTAALRAAGIPARQVYVPRWAHADDNHAWVEAWVDGEWHFLGACEPDVDLDHAWFTEPARRAMLTAAIVQGRYPLADEVLAEEPTFTRINTLPVYAATRLVAVQVLDGNDRPVAGARVDWSIYNYAEFFPIASSRTNAAGIATLRTGFGDLLAWASHDGRSSFALYSHDRGDTLRLTLGAEHPEDGEREFDIVPPPPVPIAQDEHPDAALTTARVSRGDSLRTLYESGFLDSVRVAVFARANGFATDSCWMLLRHARGNGMEMLSFLAGARDINQVPALAFLRTLAIKDLQDASAAVLLAHYRDAITARPADRACDSMYLSFVCAPRIGREELRPWRETLRLAVDEIPGLDRTQDDETRGRLIAEWVREQIRFDRENNWGIVPQPVAATYVLRAGDPYSRRLLLVAMLRAAGIPARLHPATGAAEFHAAGQWLNAGLEDEEIRPIETATLVLRPRAGQRIESPEYARHFTLARFADGVYHTLDFEGDERFSSWPARLPLPSGQYMLVTGNRQPDGSVLAVLRFFGIDDGETKDMDIRIRDDDAPPVPLGTVAAELLPDGEEPVMLLLWIERNTEPVAHALLDIADERAALGALPVSTFVAASDMGEAELSALAAAHLPTGAAVLSDGAERLKTAIAGALHLPAGYGLPLIAMCTEDGSIVFAERGYTIGVGAQILRILERLHLPE